MKFLIFNLVVAGALLFLFVSGVSGVKMPRVENEKTFEDLKGKALAAVADAQIRLDGKDLVNDFEPQEASSVFPIDDEHAPEKVTKSTLSKPIIEPESAQKLSPDVAERRDEVMQEGALPVGAQDFQVSKREDRLEQLRTLAEEMELYSVEISDQ